MSPVWTALAAAGGALVGAYLYRRAVARSAALLADGARRFAAGDYSARVHGLIPPLRATGAAFNALAGQVQQSFDELTRRRAQLATVLDQMSEGVVAVDRAGTVLLVNPALSRLLGIDPASARGRPYLETLRHNGAAELIGAVLYKGTPEAQEIRVFAPEELVFDAHAAPLARDGSPSGAVLVLHDITRLRRLETVRREFVANVSHELRTPLATIKGFAETLRAGAVDDRENRVEFLKTIEERAESLTRLVDDLLELSAIESGHRAPRPGPLRLAEVCGLAARELAPQAAARGLSLKLERMDDLPLVVADREQMRRVIANLLDNAIKYTGPGGTVELSAARGEGSVELSVRDTGVGIPDEDLPRIFERFYRVDKARTSGAGGTGLGLSIVKHIVEAHGGTVWAESRLGTGSTFRVRLPAVVTRS